MRFDKPKHQRRSKRRFHTVGMAFSLYRKLSQAAAANARAASTLAQGRKVCVIGAAGGIGQPLSLLMKMVRGPCAWVDPLPTSGL